jgi:hypothetical protein
LNAWSHFFATCTMPEDVLAVGLSCAGENALTGVSANVMHANKKAQASRKRVI